VNDAAQLEKAKAAVSDLSEVIGVSDDGDALVVMHSASGRTAIRRIIL